jgi:hypothetical protein
LRSNSSRLSFLSLLLVQLHPAPLIFCEPSSLLLGTPDCRWPPLLISLPSFARRGDENKTVSLLQVVLLLLLFVRLNLYSIAS